MHRETGNSTEHQPLNEQLYWQSCVHRGGGGRVAEPTRRLNFAAGASQQHRSFAVPSDRLAVAIPITHHERASKERVFYVEQCFHIPNGPAIP